MQPASKSQVAETTKFGILHRLFSEAADPGNPHTTPKLQSRVTANH